MLFACALHLLPSALQGQIADVTTADHPLADPVVSADVVFYGQTAKSWSEDGARLILLEGDAGFDLGVFGFRGDRAVVRIDTELKPGRTIRHLSIYLENARSAKGRTNVGAYGQRLLVTASTTGSPSVLTDLMTEVDAAPAVPLVAQARQRVARLRVAMGQPVNDLALDGVEDLASDPARLARREQIGQQNRVGSIALADKPLRAIQPDPDAAQPAVDRPPPPEGILPTRGVVQFNADRVVYERANPDRDAALMLVGNVRVFYTDYDASRVMSLTAERVVLFIDEGGDRGGAPPIAGQQMDAAKVTGVYLEDNAIITDGQYTVRAPRVFYNMAEDRAVLLEAVMYTDDIQRRVPLYVRADVLRQTSAETFEAENVRFTTSEFAEPHFAIGAQRVTIDRRADRDGVPRNLVTADKASMRWYDTPLFVLPRFQGTPSEVPLRGLTVGSSNDGFNVETQWDVFALAGKQAPKDVDLIARIDYRGDHGPAVGLDFDYRLPESFGSTKGYLVPLDNGTDSIGGRNDIDQDNEMRGFLQLQHRQLLDYGVEVSVEGAYVSDPTFLEEFYRSEAYEAKEYETSLYIKKQDNETAIDFYARYDVTDFTPQLTTLQAPGHTVARGPEARYFRTGTPLLDGRLNWYTENRLGRVRMMFGDDSPADRGFSAADSLRFFGIPNTTSFDDAAGAAGIPMDWVTRVDTRHEVEMPLEAGPFNITPYGVGRITAYDTDFSDFNGGSNEDNIRFWGGGGIRTSVEFSKTYGQARSKLFDVHQVRHIIEPVVDVFWHGSTIDGDDLPVYDPEVEGLSEGGGVRMGVVNTLQTKRGGPGMWRSVDWLRLKTDVVLRSDDADTDADIPRYFEYRPEYSTGGDHFYSELLWMVTETLGMQGDVTYNLEDDRAAQWRLGLTLDHTPRLRSFIVYREVEVLDSQLLSYGFDYQATDKYRFGFRQSIDINEGESRNIAFTLNRQLPRWELRGLLEYDAIDDEAVIGFILLPSGFGLNTSPVSLLSSR